MATVQDEGRYGLAHLGVSPSGAADQEAMHLANALLDNEGSCAVIELTLGGAEIRCWSDTQVAVTGADASLRCAGEQRPMNTATRMSAGDTIEIGVPSAGLHTYIAVSGGVDVPPVLGSRSTDTMSWLGPARIVTGTTLPIGAVRVGNRPRVPVSVPSQRLGRPLRLILGPRQNWFDPEAIAAIGSREYVVTPASNRAGIRLQGPTLQRCRQEELPSEGVVAGAVQVPPSGQPIVLFRDRSTTGGYPVIGVVVEEDLSIVAQRRPGSTVRFVIVDR